MKTGSILESWNGQTVWPYVRREAYRRPFSAEQPQSHNGARSHLHKQRFAQADYPDGTAKEKFLQYVRQILVPVLRQGDIVVMDNLSAHHAPQVAQMIHQAGAKLLYLPPYSPDLNSIEKLCFKVKAFLRKRRALTQESL